MIRILLICVTAMLAAIYGMHYAPEEIQPLILFIVFSAGAIKLFITKEWQNKFAVLLIIIFTFSGFICLYTAEQKAQTNISRFDTQSVTLTCRICEYPVQNGEYFSASAEICSFTANDIVYNDKGKIKLTFMGEIGELSLGDMITADCKITLPDDAQNRGLFNYRTYLLTDKIYNLGFVQKDAYTVVSRDNYKPLDCFKKLNRSLCENICKLFPPEEAEIINAVVLGVLTGMSYETYLLYKNSGLTHIIVVSGMHVTYLMVIFFALRKLLKIKTRLFLVVTSLAIIAFTLLTGFSPSIARAGIMAVCMTFAEAFYRKLDSLSSLSLSAIILLFINPFTAFDTSFLLSYAATLGILLLSDPMTDFFCRGQIFTDGHWWNKFLNAVVSVIIISICAQIFTLPFVAAISNEVALWGVISTLIITPVSTVVLIGGLLISAISFISNPLASLLAFLLSPCVKLFYLIVKIFGGGSGVVRLGKVLPYHYILYILTFITGIFFLKKKYRKAVLPSVLAVIFIFTHNTLAKTQNSFASVSFINVGQGDSILISLPDDTDILIDGGKYKNDEDANPATYTASSYLIKAGVKNLDFMIATHADIDHSSGLIAVLDSIKVGTLIIPESFGESEEAFALLHKAKEKQVKINTFSAGGGLKISENASLRALMPDDALIKNDKNENNTALVLKFIYGNTSFLFTADIDSSTEKYMLDKGIFTDIDCDVIKVSHHGSKYSTSKEFLDAVSPQYAVISVGKNNYGHPSEQVINNLSESGIKIFRTDESRDIIFNLTSAGIKNIIYN